ncbi:uncharacterized protein I206_101321 [Kwoniella pini CBS 10737]|uniref:RRM domain-containing protein n=1 Tax=Kwoniella pini CBS 10737 TaxID=1296096 RepID=A0A1B9IBB6_9TREE|nr:uncharacterized protein I206_00003 [Kwoniella pini CBS 10737]OCF52707.1 hypothetical protein I206_00003 [Kwoniella pini CBS 10737]
MVSPPASLPSPTPSSSSHSHFQSLSSMQPPNPPRVPSAASGISSISNREGKGYHQYSNGYNNTDYSSPAGYGEYSQPGQQPYNSSVPAAFLPAVTSSPPPHPPPYVPPPQHAMAPDPIHSLATGGPGMMGMPGPMSPTGMTSGPWPSNSGPNSWRGQPAQSGYPGQPQSQHIYQRSSLPNGSQIHVSSHPPDPYGGAGRSSMSSSFSGLGHRPNSGPGESRERRRDRDRRDKEDDGEDQEIISTIFVVGFPEDMSEREFQNIFTFASGFEAATLKLPSGSSRREPAAALLAELTQIAAAQAQAQANGEPFDYHLTQPALEEAMASLTMAATASTSASTTPSAAMSLTPSAPSGPVLGNPSLPTRRQTIGFARFKTRTDALAARESLQGKKIDPLTGATLKAEMAKKNLHTKKTTSGEELVGLLLRSGRLSNVVGVSGTQIGPGTHSLPNNVGGISHPVNSTSASVRDAWDSWPNAASGERERTSTDDSISMPPPPFTPNANQPHQGHNANDNIINAIPSSSHQAFIPSTTTQTHYASGQSNPSTSPSLSVKSPSLRQTDSKALLALAEEADELEGWSVNGAVGIGIMDGYHSQTRGGLRGDDNGTAPSIPSFGGGSSGYGSRNGQNDAYGTSPPGGSDRLSENGRGLLSGSNPADQNPPINTLYVGNLPAISPPTHPPNFLEESLRGLFSRCPGFKRMSFRQKINGPMCFVEFEEVGFASQAIKELYGHNLGGLVKGGIRLSYSKNSLGQRGNAHPSSLNTSMFGGIAHTVALAGMSMNSPTAAAAHPIPISNGQSIQGPTSAGSSSGYGLQLQQGLPQGPGQQPPASAPIPDFRRESNASSSQAQSTSLSPNAQPFNIALPNPTSPSSRYFMPGNSNKRSSPSDIPSSSFTGTAAVPIPTANSTFQPFSSSDPSSGFSPMSSPIRTPASFSWKSSGAPPGTGAGGFGAFDFATTGTALGSLNGAASAWGANSERRE